MFIIAAPIPLPRYGGKTSTKLRNATFSALSDIAIEAARSPPIQMRLKEPGNARKARIFPAMLSRKRLSKPNSVA